jgi:hypothetical protein
MLSPFMPWEHMGRGGGNYSFTHRRPIEVGGQHHAPAALPQEVTWVTNEKGAGSAPRARQNGLEVRIPSCPYRQSIQGRPILAECRLLRFHVWTDI